MNKNTNSRISNTATSLAQTIQKSTTMNSRASEMAESAQLYVTDIKNRIKNKLSSNLRMYIIVMIPVIILLCYFIYKYNFNYRETNVIVSLDYKKKNRFRKFTTMLSIR